ncbi:MAG: class II aldolase [Gammaproteobacteria bacterium]|jgi:L-fuculose-phosphate aldolase|nr:class II aldolase [Gammaproteobacteria bacterium]
MSSDEQIKQEIIDTVRMYSANGLGVGTAGNLSARTERGFLVTPTGVSYDALEPGLLVELNEAGDVISGHLKPSSEWRFHRDIYLERKEAGSIVHVHSPFATAIACNRKSIPAFHYVIAIAGGDSIRCADYATFGTEELSLHVVKALKDRKACLMANHGMIALDKDISSAFKLAIEIEELAKQYFYSLQIGELVILDKEEMQINLEKFKSYGKQT